jgi:hypothetical protein
VSKDGEQHVISFPSGKVYIDHDALKGSPSTLRELPGMALQNVSFNPGGLVTLSFSQHKGLGSLPLRATLVLSEDGYEVDHAVTGRIRPAVFSPIDVPADPSPARAAEAPEGSTSAS